MESSSKRICVIGTGASGLTAIKSCLEGGLQVVAYEKTSYIGGLWQFHETNDHDAVASVAKSTIINTSKEMSAFSDFPPPPEAPNYMRNDKMISYFHLYARKFDLQRHITFETEVTKIHLVSGIEKWQVTTKNMATKDEMSELFDGVMVCTGHHTVPFRPKFQDEDKFDGNIIHTHEYKRPSGYVDKRVAVVGVGNSGLDTAAEIADVASQVYLSTRRGTWIVHRVGDNGLPIDITQTNRLFMTLFKWFPNYVNRTIEAMLTKRFDHETYNLKPTHKFINAHASINDKLPNCILSGTVRVKGDIERFVENGVVFVGDNGEVTELDVVILGTGYQVRFPFVDRSIIETDGNNPSLYKNMFSPRVDPVSMAHTLAFIGLVQPIGAIFPISELQSRWFVALMNRDVNLPAAHEMDRDIERYKSWLAKTYYPSPRHTLQVNPLMYMDEIAGMIGAEPKILQLILKGDWTLAKALVFGPPAAYQYRLRGPHSWPGARTAILSIMDRVRKPLQTRQDAASVN